jgi:uncharacterized protein YeaO (DUF488 family)
MAIRMVRLGSSRRPREGVRIGTVRHPPRGVPRTEYAKRDLFDVWLPNLAPSAPLLRSIDRSRRDWWKKFGQAYRKEMRQAEASRVLDTLAALSRDADFSVGCYCEDEATCHRSILRELLEARGARIVA